MAMYWLLSLVCLLTPLSSAAQGYSGGGIVDETITESVTETVTKVVNSFHALYNLFPQHLFYNCNNYTANPDSGQWVD
ncbi:hypothetical protein Daesc_010511 [Daldinia eschscholtzii]|uniref:Uncharacterized protein n=1 Tax=Daldinia eschscholtzii TaxID=292717 RepID=A0AAX6M7W2_9PEZI